jgi:hypothetical protein
MGLLYLYLLRLIRREAGSVVSNAAEAIYNTAKMNRINDEG